MKLISFHMVTWYAKIDAAPHQCNSSGHCVYLLALATCPIIDSWLSFLWCIRVSRQLVLRCISLFSVLQKYHS
jgi:hypothetical protein